METPALLLHLFGRGITVSPLPGGNLLVKPAARLTDTDRDAIRAHKPALVDLLQRQSPTTAPGALPAEIRALIGLDDAEIERIGRYIEQARRHGFGLDDAEALADRLLLRDRLGADVRMCIECRHLERSGRCAAARSGRVVGAGRELQPVRAELHRCAGFAER